MWIFLNDAMLSIVQLVGDDLLVRTRIKGDIERVFPDFKAAIRITPEADYRFRAVIPRYMVASAIAGAIAREITYDNFKSSVEEDARRNAYLRVWQVMHDEQERRVQNMRKKWKQK